MSYKMRRLLVVMIAALMVLMEPVMQLAGSGVVFANVGSIADGEDITYDKNGGVLASLGFDTSKMPSTYDPDSTANPYGADVSTLDEVKEGVWFDTMKDAASDSRTVVYGHNKKLDASLSTFLNNPVQKSVNFLKRFDFMSAVKCDLNGDGRDSALAIVYTHYNQTSIEDDEANRKILMCLYDPISGRHSDPFEISSFTADEDGKERFILDYLIQSQLQITAGDYDKDSVDEIAVYAPSPDENTRNKVMFFDLVEGKDCQDPFTFAAWRQSWNFVLPLSGDEIINSTREPGQTRFLKNVYNNVDLKSGDADNDGICDLILSYGASDTDYLKQVKGNEQKIVRSIASKSVLLYGSDQGQMLKDAQEISYGGENLIRVSFAFGDVTGDGNEDMFIAGQSQEEQDDNISRTIGRYVYDSGADEMLLESMQNLKVVNGTWDDDHKVFYPANGWDGYYHSAPLMKTNIVVGNIMSADSTTKIYLDSVLYSYDDDNYAIVDELEDASQVGRARKGSCVFAKENAMLGYYDKPQEEASYYEYGSDCGNYTASVANYVTVNRVSIRKTTGNNITGKDVEACASILYMDPESKKYKRTDPIYGTSSVIGKEYGSEHIGPPIMAIPADTDVDSMVAEYTGNHEITYQDPNVLAVLASAPYFKDVAAYDNDEMLGDCSTEYGQSKGQSNGHESTYSSHLGVFLNSQIGSDAFHIVVNLATGWAREETWGWEEEREFEMSYETAGGEDAVVMYSVPTENYIYKVKGVTVDDDGNTKEFTNTMAVSKPHLPVTQTLTLDDYMEIQSKSDYNEVLPDITEYLASTPGDPSSYPKNSLDLPEKAKKNLDKTTKHYIDSGNKWCGVSFGSGSETQTITYSKETRDRYKNHMDGGYGTVEVGLGTEERLILIFNSTEGGISYDFEQLGGDTNASIEGSDCAGTVPNMPRDAKTYGYYFSWQLFKYNVKDECGCSFPVITYLVNDVEMPPELPDNIEQDFDKTTDSQIALTWTYNKGNPQQFDIYRYEDFPIGGGDKLVGTVGGSEYRIQKDEAGNTLKDDDGNVIKQFTFIDTDLSADSKYSYRMKVRRQKLPGESIFSPVIEARTTVSEKPDVSLTADKLNIYPDSTYDIKVNLADPDHYQKDINYQWQKYNVVDRKWEDLKGCDKVKLHFFNCKSDDEGEYRCRVNLIRKKESSPQYISVFTETCTVDYSLRSVDFGPIQVFEGTGNAAQNTGISVKLTNSSKASLERPTGKVIFSIDGPNGLLQAGAVIDEATGIAKLDSLEDMVGTIGQQSLVDGGYLITATYAGSAIFYPADDPEEYHYLRNIDECEFFSAKSSYYFGDDIMETARLYDYKIGKNGKVTRTDVTDDVAMIVLYPVADDGVSKKEPAVRTWSFDRTGGKAPITFNKALAKKAYIEVYDEEHQNPVAHTVVNTMKIPVQFDIDDKITGTGDLLEFMSSEDLTITNNVDPDVKNIETREGMKSLSDFMVFGYYEQNGDFICDSAHTDEHKDDFIPASYYADITLKKADDGDDAYWFYKPSFKGGRFMVVGNYYHVSAGPKDKSSGSVKMLSPDDLTDFTKQGYVGGTKIVLKAVPNKGYEISRWIIDDCGVKTTTLPGTDKITYTVRSQNTVGDGEVVISADMTPKDNRLTYKSIGNGQITVSPNVESGATVLAETQMTFTAKPDDEWRFVEWRWANDGGSNIVTGGVAQEDGTNTKTFTMPDNSASLYGVFAKNTLDIALTGDIDVSYINKNGSNPYYEDGATVQAEKGREIPLGVDVTASVKQGSQLAPGSKWTVMVTTPQGITPIDPQEIMVHGRPGCTFSLPDDATACSISADTSKGKFSVYAYAPDSFFNVKVDGRDVELEDREVNGIESGSQVDVTALPVRGKKVASWVINGSTLDYQGATYSMNITENMNLSVNTEAEEKYALKVKAEGGGTGGYTITDLNGKEYTGTFQDTEKTVDVYKGEKVKIAASPDDTKHTMTALFMDGVQQDFEGGEFTISSIDKDTTILCRFGSNKFHDVTFSKDQRATAHTIKDEDGAELNSGDMLKVADGGTLKFSVTMQNSGSTVVLVNGEQIQPDHQDDPDPYNTTLYYVIPDVSDKLDILVTDHLTRTIGSAQDFVDYMALLAQAVQPADQPDAVLAEDITIPAGTVIQTPLYSEATFDGQGHTITGLTYGSESSRIKDFNGIFGRLSTKGQVKNLKLVNTTVYAERGTAPGCGLLTYQNEGTITNVEISGETFADFDCENRNESVGALAYENKGTIQNCSVTGLSIKSTSTIYDGDQTWINYRNRVGSAGVAVNHDPGSLKCNYFEGLTIKGSDIDAPEPAKKNIVANAQMDNNEAFDQNYFKQTFDAVDENGISVFSRTADPDDEEKATAEAAAPDFVRKLAYDINSAGNSKAWGTTDADKADLKLTAVNGENCKAPVKVDFSANGGTVTRYYYPGLNTIPEKSEFSGPYPIFFAIGNKAYSTGAMAEFEKDMAVSAAGEMEGFVAALSSSDVTFADVPCVYYKNIEDAVKDTMDHTIIGPQLLTIQGYCILDNMDFVIDQTTTVNVGGMGVTFTLAKNAQIINGGNFTVKQMSTMHKYGSIENMGTVTIENNAELYNYGSTFDNKEGSVVNGRGNIKCRPHIYGDWEYADKPDEHGEWTKTSTCKVCGNEITEKVEPDPPVSTVDKISVMTEPDVTIYELGEKFSSKGLSVVATLTDGTKAAITKYTLMLNQGDAVSEIKDGDELNTEGDGKVIVVYENLTTSFDIEVLNMAGLLTVTDSEGVAITEASMEPGMTLGLKAALTNKLPYKTAFKWESSNTAVAELETYGTAAENKVTAGDPGEATITVTVVNEQGAPVDEIRPKTVKITNLSHVTAIEIDGGDFTLKKGDFHEVKYMVSPSNTTDVLEWTSSNEKVATVDQNGKVKGVGGGDALITVAAPNGISDSRKVHVYEKAQQLSIEPETLDMRTDDYDVIAARVINAGANGEVTWTVDDVNVAGFYVRNMHTGEMEIVDKVTTELSADGSDASDAYVVLAGLSDGEATVKAQTEAESGEMLEKECKVTVTTVERFVHITHNGAPVAGEPMRLALQGHFIQLGAESSEQDDSFIWSTVDDLEDPVLKVDNRGGVVLKRKGLGAVKVTSEKSGEDDVCLIEVYVEPTGVTLSDDEISLKEKGTYRLDASLEPEDAEGEVIWTSSDESIATVSKDGVVTALKKGEALITATPDAEGAKSSSCKVTVYDPKLDIELSSTKFTYDKKQHMPTVTIKNNGTVLAKGLTKSTEDFVIIVSSADSMLPGKYRITVISEDQSYTSGEADYTIEVKPTELKKLKKGKKRFKAYWKKKSSTNVTGYQVRYSTKKNMSGAKIKTIKKASQSSVTIKNLKGGKKYYVQVRTYAQKGGVKYFSANWSKTKSVKTKK